MGAPHTRGGGGGGGGGGGSRIALSDRRESKGNEFEASPITPDALNIAKISCDISAKRFGTSLTLRKRGTRAARRRNARGLFVLS